MNTRKAVAAAFGVALLGAGTSAVVGGAAHGQLNKNKTGTATSSQVGQAGDTIAECSSCNPSLDASTNIKSAVGVRHGRNSNFQDNNFKTKSGNANGSTHGSAKSGKQKFHIG